jgi:hypothetical protein
VRFQDRCLGKEESLTDGHRHNLDQKAKFPFRNQRKESVSIISMGGGVEEAGGS